MFNLRNEEFQGGMPTRGLARHFRFYKGSIPNPSVAAIAGMQADMANYGQNWLVNAAAQKGGKIKIGNKTYDFTGLGNADQAAASTDATDAATLAIEQKYGAGYIQQALDNLKQSNPTGVAARQQLSDKIQATSQDTSAGALSNDTQKQVEDMLSHAGELDPAALQETQQAVRGGQVARGITLGNAPANQEADAVVGASDNLRTQQEGVAQNYLASGVSPQDVQYRKIQQSLSNLGAFTNNQTPEAQFGQLSGAQNGAAPTNAPNYSTPANLDPNAGGYGINFANQSYQTSQQNGNPWLNGLSIATNGLSAVSNLYKPSAPPTSNYGVYGGAGVPSGTFTTPTASYAPSTPEAMSGMGY